MTAPLVSVRRNRSGALALEFDGTLYLADGRALPFFGREGAWEETDLDVSVAAPAAIRAVDEAVLRQEQHAADASALRSIDADLEAAADAALRAFLRDLCVDLRCGLLV